MAASIDLSHRFDGESVGRALELVGERWTLLILREAFFGVRRFGQLARNLNIPRPTLSSRLRMLVEAGLLERVPYSVDPERHEYRLTAPGAIYSARSSCSCDGATSICRTPTDRQSYCATTTAARSPMHC